MHHSALEAICDKLLSSFAFNFNLRRYIKKEGGEDFTKKLFPGDTFGEVALLHSIPRSATVSASGEKAKVWALLAPISSSHSCSSSVSSSPSYSCSSSSSSSSSSYSSSSSSSSSTPSSSSSSSSSSSPYSSSSSTPSSPRISHPRFVELHGIL